MAFAWLALALPIGILVVAALIAAWRRPALGLGILAVGLAVHNAAIMLLLDLDAPSLVVRVLQAWKEVVLVVVIARIGYRAWREGLGSWSTVRFRALGRGRARGVRLLDGLAVAFTVLILVYLVAPFVSSFGSDTTIAQRILSFRIFILIPILYAIGRFVGAKDRDATRWSVDLVVVAATLVAVVGLAELWFLPTRYWLDLGVTKFTALQGFDYGGPGGLPENFFQSTTIGYGLRRMVSTYISPLGIAYTGLLVVPMIVGGIVTVRRPSAWRWIALALVLLSIAFSVTRLAVLCLVAEAVLWVILTRRPAAIVAGALAFAAAGLAFSVYPLAGPLVRFDLSDVRPPAGAALFFGTDVIEGPNQSPPPADPAAPDIVGSIVTQQDASIQNHILAVRDGLMHAIEHPLGIGLGSTMPRFGTATGPAESAFLGIVGETGVLGGVIFATLYGGVIVVGLIVASRFRERPWRDIALLVGVGGIGLAPVVMTSAVWGDFSVTFLYWWAAGVAVSVLGQVDASKGGTPIPSGPPPATVTP